MTLHFSRPDLPEDVQKNTRIIADWLNYGVQWRSEKRESVERILEEGRFDARAEHSMANDLEPLIYHAIVGHETVAVRAFVKAGMPVDLSNKDNFTPLQCAIIQSDNDSAQALLEEGANLNVRHVRSTVSAVVNNQINVLDLFKTCRQQGQQTFDDWHQNRLQPADLTHQHIMQMLNVWPLDNPHAPVPRMEHLEAIFKDPRWKEEDFEHKAGLIQQIQGLSVREQLFLLGGHAQQILSRQNQQSGLTR